MYAVNAMLLLAVFWDAQIVRWVVWVGLVVLTVALLILVRTRWGQSQPLGKCVVLSLLAHLLLGIYTTTVNIVTATVGSPDGQGVQVALIDSSSGETNPGAPPLWDSLSGQEPGEGLGTVPDLAAPALAAEIPSTAQIERHAPDDSASTAPQSKLPDVPTHDAGPPVFAPSRDPLSVRPIVKEAEPIEMPPAPTGSTDNLVPPPEQVDNTGSQPTSGNSEKPINPKGSGNDSATSALPLGPVPNAEAASGAGNRLMGRSASSKPSSLPEIYKLRMGNHSQVAKGLGATQDTEAAVNAALRFLAANQGGNGRWEARRMEGGAARAGDGQDRQAAGAQADTGITGLVLLSFLAAGNTHLQGPHLATVRRGLEFLLSVQDSSGNLGVSPNIYEQMYSHAMATCALSEAYAMSGDDRLQNAVRRAIGYTIAAQDRRGGGWRYHPGDPGDTSLLGWQVMSLKSAQLAGIAVPDTTRDGIARFLKSVADGRSGGLARYQPSPARPSSRPMTAEALVCRQFLGLPDTPASLNEASDFLLQEPPGVGRTNHYYWYYATLAMYQMQGEAWRQWNEALQKQLLASQRQGGELAGSWDPDPVWGGCGGRAYSTALSALCLEVYYRFLPLYVEAAGRDRRAK